MGGQNIDGDAFPNFFGTSAAAPHAAGVAAMLLEAKKKFYGKPSHLRMYGSSCNRLRWTCTVQGSISIPEVDLFKPMLPLLP